MKVKGTLTRVVPPDDGKRQPRTRLATQLDSPGTFFPPPAEMLDTAPDEPMVIETLTFAELCWAAPTSAKQRRDTLRRFAPTTAET
jgi:hypothetical protein